MPEYEYPELDALIYQSEQRASRLPGTLNFPTPEPIALFLLYKPKSSLYRFSRF